MEPKKEEGTDFSHFFKPNTNFAPESADNQGEKSPAKKYIAIVFSIIALLVAGYLIFNATRPAKPAANYEAPAGYRMTNSPNEPPKLEKVK